MPQVGEVIGGRYRLVTKLGDGGMGSVFLALHVDLGVRVAVKFLHPNHASDPSSIERFQREAKAAAAVGHPAIVGIQDVGVTRSGLHYHVLEYLEGQSLYDSLMRTRRFPPALAAYIGCQVLSGLSAAHKAGIVHRDVKPENIFLVETGAPWPDVKVLDFGISSVFGSEQGGGNDRLTQTGTVLGTPRYMSPEQARGREDLDPRCDLFAVGVILYECVTGTVPFDGPNYNAILTSIITEDPPRPRALCPELDAGLEKVVLKALRRRREDRYSSAAEMFEHLWPFVEDKAQGRISVPGGKSLLVAKQQKDDLYRTAMSWESGPVPRWSSTLRGALVATVVVATIAMGALLGLVWLGDDTAENMDQRSQALTAAPEAGSAPAEDSGQPVMATITLRGLPTDALVFVDDELWVDRPIKLPAKGVVNTIRVEQDGYYPFVYKAKVARDVSIDVRLEPLPPLPSKKRRPVHKQREQPGPAPNTNKAEPGYFVPVPQPGYLGDR